MTVERTEEAGLSGFLDVTMGGSPVRLRALTLDESDAWLDQLAVTMANAEFLDGDTSEEQMRSLFQHASRAALALVQAYDIDGALGDDLRSRATKVEVANALEMMVKVEDPLAVASPRTVAAVFGLPAQMAAERMAMASEPVLRLVRSLNTLSASGASTTPATSGHAGPASSSSSTGRTRRTAIAGTPTSAAS